MLKLERANEVSLEALTDGIMTKARRAGVSVKPLGTHPLFDEARLYHGTSTDWVLGPGQADTLLEGQETAVPREVLGDLRRLLDADLNFPAIYIAHEVPKRVGTIRPSECQVPNKLDTESQPRTQLN